MNFTDAKLVEQVVWEMKRADYPRADNRALIDRLFNGFPPWTAQEAESAQIQTNVNFLDGPKLAADARRSYYNAFLKPANFFTMALQRGPDRMRGTWSAIVTKEINRVMKDSLCYFEVIRSQMASTVLHGIGAVHWPDLEKWKPRAIDVADLLIPSNTLLSMENLTHFAIFRSYTAPELSDMVERKNLDPGWNRQLARRAVRWVMDQPLGRRTAWDTLSPEKIVEEIKQDGVYYGSDVVPTIDCWDVYYLNEEGPRQGWRRCIILDTPPQGEISDGGKPKMTMRDLGMNDTDWLYYGGKRIYAEDIKQILHFQFGDLSPKSPFKYHSVRSLGWLIYAVCNLQNRLRCKVNDATFENLLNYFRVANMEDADRLTKIDLHNYGLVPDGVEFIKQQDRWQINHALVLATMADNRQMMNEAAAQFREGRDTAATKEKTATEIMAEVNSANALVGTMLLLSYTYQKQQYQEIVRRFFTANSRDPDVRAFRLRVLKQGVPDYLLDPDFWTVDPEQVLGSGNKMLQIAMADKLMAVRPLLDPDAQRDVVRMYVQANSDDPNLAVRWVPTQPILVTESMHDAELVAGSLMAGVKVRPRAGQDPTQMMMGLLKSVGEIADGILAASQTPTKREVAGLANIAQAINGYMNLSAQDPANKDLVADVRKQLAALVRQLVQWNQQLMEQSQEGNGGVDPKIAKELALTQAKVEGMQAQIQAKIQADNAKNAQRIGQREEQFQQKQRQLEEQHIATLRKKLQDTQVETTIADAKAATEIQNDRMATMAELDQGEPPNA
jgi:hypothetical protein